PLQMRDGQLEGGEAFQLEGRCILIYEEDSKAMELHSAVARELCMKVITANRPGDFLASLDNRVELLMVCDSLHDTSIQEILYKAHAVVPALPLIVAGYRGRMQDMGVIKNPENILFKPFLASEFAQMAMRALDIRSSRQLNLYPADMEPVDKQGINVLLAEDNAIAAKVISTLLIQRGHRVRITKDGSEALQAVSDEDYELAFIDLRMPNMDGLEFTRRYRSIEPKHRYMPIYALTANSVHEMFDRCVEAGMDGFLTKPVEPEMLDAIIEQCKLNINRPSPGESHPVPT
ncbi:MAG: response regulator, partial [Candidatus Thiodiazotropha endolucinida]